MRLVAPLVALALAACQPSADTPASEAPTVSQAASTPAAWADTFPQYPILHDRTIEEDLWVFTHDAITTCGTRSDHVRVWAVRKAFSQGKTIPEMVFNPKAGRTNDDEFQAALQDYIACVQPIAERNSR